MWTKPTSPVVGSPPTTGGEDAMAAAAASFSSPSRKIKNPGRRMAQIVRLKPEAAARYKEVHASVWPEVKKQIKHCNIEDYSIFYDADTSILFATFRYVGYDYAGDMERMRENPKVREWWAVTDGLQESMVPGATSSESGEPSWWKPVEEVFYMA